MPQGKYVGTTTTIAGAISDAGSLIEELKDEMSEWRDAMEEKLSHTDKYERVSECADTLEQSDVTSRAEELIAALEEACKGKPAEPGCPQHIVGKRCSLCKWDGVAETPRGEKKTIKRFNPPKREKTSGKPRWTYAEVSAGWSSEIYQHDATDSKATRAKTLAEFERDVVPAIKAENKRLATPVIPTGRAPKPEVLPIQALAGLVDAKVQYSEFQAYKGKGTSRANRLSNATSGAKAAIEDIREALDKCESDDRIADITNALDEFEGAIDECEGVDFPGMYG